MSSAVSSSLKRPTTISKDMMKYEQTQNVAQISEEKLEQFLATGSHRALFSGTISFYFLFIYSVPSVSPGNCRLRAEASSTRLSLSPFRFIFFLSFSLQRLENDALTIAQNALASSPSLRGWIEKEESAGSEIITTSTLLFLSLCSRTGTYGSGDCNPQKAVTQPARPHGRQAATGTAKKKKKNAAARASGCAAQPGSGMNEETNLTLKGGWRGDGATERGRAEKKNNKSATDLAMLLECRGRAHRVSRKEKRQKERKKNRFAFEDDDSVHVMRTYRPLFRIRSPFSSPIGERVSERAFKARQQPFCH